MKLGYLASTTIAATAALGLSASASAGVVNFDQSSAVSPSGQVSYNGNGGPLTGKDISFDQVNLNGATAPGDNNESLYCDSCTINFTTGDLKSQSNNEYTFNDGGNFTLNGRVTTGQDGTGTTVADGTDGNFLFQGELTSPEGANTQTVLKTGSNSLITSLFGTDDFNDDLAAYYGLDEDATYDFSNTEISLGTTSFGEDGSFVASELQNADVTARPSASVPEPQELGIFGLGVAMLLAGLGFRRKSETGMV